MTNKLIRHGNAETQITVLQQWVKPKEAEEHAADEGGRLPTKKEFIRALKDPEFYNKVQQGCYRLSGGPELGISGRCKIDYKKGDVVGVSTSGWRDLLPKEKAWVDTGNGLLTIGVGSLVDEYRILLSSNDRSVSIVRLALIKKAETSILRSQKPEIREVKVAARK